MWEKVVDVINGGKKFIVTSHLFLEGDAVGSEIALRHFLASLGKEAIILNNEALPVAYRYFDPGKEAKFVKKEGNNINIQDYDAIFIVDVGNWEQLGDFAEKIQSSSIRTVCIDHHASNPAYADINVIEKDASSTGELIFDLITHMQGRITKEIAESLYLAIATDTGWFKFSNTSATALNACAALLKIGVKPEILFGIIYQSKSWSYLKLISLALEELRSECDGCLAWTKITRKMAKSSGVEYVDTDALIDLIRSVKRVEVVILFRELNEKKTKFSLRSKHTIDVSKLAAQFGGGGHVRAAGASVNKPIDQVIKEVLVEAKDLIGRTLA